MRRKVLGVTLAVVATVAATFAGAGAASASPPPPSPIPNSTPGWLGHATKGGPANGAVSARVYLAPAGGMDALAALATAVSTPGSAQYRHFLSADQYHATFDASPSTVDAVTAWLQGAGLKTTVDPSHRYVDVKGGVGNANKAFGVTISNYTHDGLTVQSPDGAASTPGALAGAVIAVDGLDTTPSLVEPKTQKPAPPDGGFRNSPICGTTYGSANPGNLATPDGTTLPAFDGTALPYSPCGYTGPVPDDVVDGWAELSSSLDTEAPMGDLDIEAATPDVAEIRESEELVAAQGRTSFCVVALAPDGRVAAYSQLVVSGDDSSAYQWGTLVRREDRGHRLGMRVKLENLRRLQQELPGTPRVVTYNAESNEHMLAVNVALGFRPSGRLAELQKRIG